VASARAKSLSARIFIGFLVVLVVFLGVMGVAFNRMHRLRQDLHLINESYLQLDLELGDLRAVQRNLLNAIDQRRQGGSDAKFLRDQLRNQVFLALLYRQQDCLSEALKVVEKGHALNPSDRDQRFLDQFGGRLKSLHAAFVRNRPLFDRLFSGAAADKTKTEVVGADLYRREHRLDKQIKRMRDDLHQQLKGAAEQVEVEEERTIWAILALVVVALLVSLVVTYRSQRTLRPLKTLVAGTKRIGSGDYAHRVTIDSGDELGVLGREFNKMAADIETREQRLIRSERMAAAGKIASHITHEIRNPLSSIALNSELLEEEIERSLTGESAADALNLCKAMQREADRLTDITEEYLRFARLPKPVLELEDLNEILTSLISFISGELSGKRIDVAEDLQQPIPQVEADENQLRQAFLNLMRNASEAMARSGGTLKVSTRAPDECVEVRVSDTGIGIDSENLSKVFEPFFSTKESGTGLGLALTHQIIQEHGGTIDVASTPGEGTEFIIRIPTAHQG
jgi:signal transduction histidine kinase